MKMRGMGGMWPIQIESTFTDFDFIHYRIFGILSPIFTPKCAVQSKGSKKGRPNGGGAIGNDWPSLLPTIEDTMELY
jgi:hypothetical protein